MLLFGLQKDEVYGIICSINSYMGVVFVKTRWIAVCFVCILLTSCVSVVTIPPKESQGESESAFTEKKPISPVLYTVSGHNEADIASALSTRLTKENLTLTELNLLSEGRVPQDAACVLIGVPEYDFSADEITMLKDYMESGGSVFLLSYFTYFTEEKMPNLYAFTVELGLRAEEGLLCEEDGDHFYLTNYYLLPDLNTESFAADALSAKNIDVLLQGAQGLSETESHEGYTVTAILSSSDKAYLKSMQGSGENTPIAKEDGDRTGKFMAAAEVMASEENDGGKLFWYTSPSILSTGVLGNMELFVSNIIAICGAGTGEK